jgi:hypothetical protein
VWEVWGQLTMRVLMATEKEKEMKLDEEKRMRKVEG